MATFDSSDKTNPAFYKPSESALLLLDFHTLFVQKAGGLRATAALQVAADMRRWAQAHGISVLHALIDTGATPYETCKGSERLGGIINAMKGAGEAEPEELLGGGGANEVTFKRTPGHVSALKSPGMLEWLHEKGIKSLILTGLSTSGCVMRTTVPATDAEFVVTVISDACADSDEGVHDLLCTKILPTRAYVSIAKDFQEGYLAATTGR